MSNLQGAVTFVSILGVFFGTGMIVYLANQVFKALTGISPIYRLIRYIETH